MRTYVYEIIASYWHRFQVWLNPISEINRCYVKQFGHKPNLKNPKNLIEKIYWLLLYTDTSLWTKCADKFAMREYIKECGYEESLPKNYGKWDSAEDIDFSSLPNEFVMKANNGCGTVLIVHDKGRLDIKKTRKKMNHWLTVPFGWSGAQLHYTRIKPCIIAEELLKQNVDQKSYSPKSQVDYKVWCLNGKPESILIVFNRDSNGYYLDLYDPKWNRLDKYLKSNGHHKLRQEPIPMPVCKDEMLSIATRLAQPFPEVRVDFYVVGDKPVIGELTFTTGYGYFTDEYYDYLGSKIDLSKIKR